jgi:hypothetical protein
MFVKKWNSILISLRPFPYAFIVHNKIQVFVGPFEFFSLWDWAIDDIYLEGWNN